VRVTATICAIADSIRWAEQIMEEIDRRNPTKAAQQHADGLISVLRASGSMQHLR